MTLLFCDMVGSSALATLLDPEEHCQVITEFQQCCATVIRRFDGLVAQYQGDGLLAYFGYPKAHEDDAERAVRAGLALAEEVSALRPAQGVRLEARVGVATGLVVVGDLVLGDARQQNSAYGEAINLAARLQSIARPNSVVIDVSTFQLVGKMFCYRDLGMRKLKGFRDPAQLREVLGSSAVQNRFEARQRSDTPPLVGRHDVLASVLRRWNRAKLGHGSMVLLSGEAGIGKSRITRSVEERLAADPHIRIAYHGSPYHKDTALHPVTTQLFRAARLSQSDGPEANLAKLRRLLEQSSTDLDADVPIFAELLSIPADERKPGADWTPRQRKERTLDALLAQYRRLCAKSPVLLIFEDLHWVDPTSVELLTRLVAQVARLPLLAVVTTRPEFTAPWRSGEGCARHEVTRLEPPEARQLVLSLAGDKALPDGLIDQILQRADGVPLFVEELTKTVLESNLSSSPEIRGKPTRWLPLHTIPSTLQSSLLARLDHLSSGKDVAQIGAAIGREFSYELILAVASLPEDVLHAALERLSGAGLIFQRGTIPAATFRFKHALLRDAAYESLLLARRQELHRRIARALEAGSAGSATGHHALLGHHHSLAAEYPAAIACWRTAAEQAIARSALVEAANLLEKALEVVPHLEARDAPALIELDLRLELGTVLRSLHGYAAPEAERQYLQARRSASLSPDRSKRFSVEWGLFQCCFVKGDIRASDDIAHRLPELAGDDADRMVDARIAQGMVQHLRGELVGARSSFEAAFALMRPGPYAPHLLTHGQDPRIFCTSYLARTLWYLGYADEAKQMIARNVAAAEARIREPSHLYGYANALASAAGIHVNRREPGLVREFGRKLLAISDQQDFSYYRALAKIDLAWADSVDGDLGYGILEMQEGLFRLERTGTANILPGYYARLAEARCRAGQIREGLECIRHVHSADGSQVWDAEVLRVKGELLATIPDRFDEAATAFRSSLQIARDQRARSLELRTALSYALWLKSTRRVREAQDVLSRAVSRLDGGSATTEMRDACQFLERLRGVEATEI